MGDMVLQALQEAGTTFVRSAVAMVPRIVITLSVVVVGWVIATALRRLASSALP